MRRILSIPAAEKSSIVTKPCFRSFRRKDTSPSEGRDSANRGRGRGHHRTRCAGMHGSHGVVDHTLQVLVLQSILLGTRGMHQASKAKAL